MAVVVAVAIIAITITITIIINFIIIFIFIFITIFIIVIASPRYTRADFMFCTGSYAAAAAAAADSCPRDNFWTNFWISFIFGTIVGPDLEINWLDFGHFRRDLDLEFSRSNIELAISQPKKVRLPRNEEQPHRLNSSLKMGPSGLTLAMTLTLNFQGQISNWIYLSKKWCDCHETKSKHIDWSQDLKCDH